MKKKYIFVPLIAVSICVISFWFTVPQEGRWVIGWAISSVYEVPKCTAQVATRWGIKDDFFEIKEYIINTLEIGMTRQEVQKSLEQFGEIVVKDRLTLDNGDFLESVLIRLCENPFGNVLLDIHYSKDGSLIKAIDSNPQ
jgi:hypothetical protein